MKPLSVIMQALLLAIISFSIFSPALFAPLNPVDDRALIQWLFTLESTGFSDLFVWSSGNFYRPLLLSSYLLDLHLWGAATQSMHLENILLHVVNVLFLFSCALVVMPRKSSAPFLAALLFAIHPLNTEAVNWISGRSDLLACVFVLLSARLLLHGLATDRPFFAFLSVLALIPGFFSKETAVFFIPAALLIILSDKGFSGNSKTSLLHSIKKRWLFVLPYLALPFLYLASRIILTLSTPANFFSLRRILSNAPSDFLVNLQTALQGFGFYTRKMLFPWPLNFTISQVPDYYFWVGLAAVPFVAYCLWRRSLSDGLFLASICLGSSAILAMLLRPGWTPVAERYMYLPSAFFCLAVTVLIYRLLSHVSFRHLAPLPVFLIMGGLASATVQRNLVWQDNVRLFQDTVNKSPDFPFVRSVLADLLIEAGQVEEGREMIRTTTAPEGLRNADFLELKRANLLYSEGDLISARALIIEKRRQDGQLYHTFQKLLAKVDADLVTQLSGAVQREMIDETVAVHLELQQAYNDPFYYYRLGQVFLKLNDPDQAARYFQLASDAAPDGVYYKVAAQRLAEQLLNQ